MGKHEDNYGSKKDLVMYRIQTSKSNLNSAKILLEAEEYKSANNRAYYAIFDAINAIHALDGNAYKRHKDVISNFNKEYVKPEIFPREMGRKIDEAERQVSVANEFIRLVEDYCKAQLEDE